MSYDGQSGPYSNAPSTYPGGPAPNQGPPPQYQKYNGNNECPNNTAASSYYSSYPNGPSQFDTNNSVIEPVQYDQNGYPIQQNNQTNPNEDRGLGTMALGAMGGVAANKFTGGKHSNLAYAAGGAALAEGAVLAYELLEGRHHRHGHGFGGRGGFGMGGFGGRGGFGLGGLGGRGGFGRGGGFGHRGIGRGRGFGGRGGLFGGRDGMRGEF